ncbi:hypothetical protein FNE52_04380 [Helicobacter pylori]|nr:hypothetical protein FNE52_04380 [Helicobacter pylori]
MTAETIRPALQIIKTKPGVSLVSSVFFNVFRHSSASFWGLRDYP